jgi:hypothetical protein
MAASWAVGVLALMAGGRDGGGGRTVAAMLPMVRHGFKVLIWMNGFDPPQLEVIGDLAVGDIKN